MAETVHQFESADFAGFAKIGVALESLARASRFATTQIKALDGVLRSFDTEENWATLPGEWPDNFTLLNRYLRTGVRPEFLFND